MSRTINLRNIVLDALLTGEELCAGTFAKANGLVAESVNRVLRDLGKHLEKRPAPKEPGKRRVYYRARNMVALQRIRNEKKLGTNQYSNGAVAAAALSFDELLAVWGISLKHLDVPSTTHIMHDEPEAAAA